MARPSRTMLNGSGESGDLFFSLICDLFWTLFYEHLKKIYILLFLDGIFCVDWLCPSGPMCHSRTLFFLVIICLDNLSTDVYGVLNSLTIIIIPLISLCIH